MHSNSTKRPLYFTIACMLAVLPACAAQDKGVQIETPAAGIGQAPTASSVAEAMGTITVDERPAIALEPWRAIQIQGKAAAGVEKIEDRITKCREFLKEHGEHQEAGSVLEALSEALVETGNFKPEELAALVERRVELDEESTRLPAELVRKYHVKHKLPAASAVKVLAMGRERIAEQVGQLQLQKDEQVRIRRQLSFEYLIADSYVVEARVQLAHGQPASALEALVHAQTAATKVGGGLTLTGSDGAELRTLSTGMFDNLHILRAAAHQQLEQPKEAKAALAQTLGFVDDLAVRKLYDSTREKLGMSTTAGQVVKAEAITAQDFKLKNLAGKTVKLSDYRGKVVLVAFWATWCGPCKRELPELVKFKRDNKDKGVELLAVNIDRFADRGKIKPFMDKASLSMNVLLEQPEQLTSYSYGGIPALYVVDRKGQIAHARTGYDPELKEKLSHEILEIVQGNRKSGRDVLSIELAPEGFGVLWQKPVNGDAMALAFGAPLGDKPGELGVVTRKGLQRYDAKGQALGTKPITGWTRTLQASDLDGDGQREWIVGGWQGVKVLDASGGVYWENEERGASIAGVRDLNGDGFSEIVLKGQDRVSVMKTVPEPLWKTPAVSQLEAAAISPKGGVLMQADGLLTEFDARGQVTAEPRAVPQGKFLAGRLKTKDGSVDVFKGQWGAQPIVDVDVDGDGNNDIVVPTRQGVVVYDQKGTQLLRIRSHDVGVEVTVGEFDGKPGAEVGIFVEHYGLVVLGRS